ncbi:MAG: hypothetical protein JSV03_13725, partial [Planctomycetota bacterium]
EQYRPVMHALLDCILNFGINADGMMFIIINPKTGEVTHKILSDGWGYVYNAFLTAAEVDGDERYRQPVTHVLNNIHKYIGSEWEGLGGADQYADSIEGAINLLNRIPVASAMTWVDEQIKYIFDTQHHDGIIEGWYGDGNSARTALMYALWKTQGIAPAPWREDLQLGAVRDTDGSLKIYIKSEWPWVGRLRFDRARHRVVFHMPMDYPRINQFPEWFTVDRHKQYEIIRASGKPEIVEGSKLFNYKLSLKANQPLQVTVKEYRKSATN